MANETRKSTRIPRPFLKWAGGKAQIEDELFARAPVSFGHYYEPFVGGGAFFFKLYRDSRITKAHISDLNAELMAAYIAIRDQVDEVIRIVNSYPHDREFFYRLRSADPWKMELPARTARMIYLNKTGYNGLYRVNRQGKFNVPFGRYVHPKYYDAGNLRAVSQALQDVVITCLPFEQMVTDARAGDLVYFDPPYVPLSRTAHFTAYQADGFGSQDQIRLRDVCLDLDRKRVFFMMSNSAIPWVRELYTQPGFHLEEILANRAINSKGAGRGKLPELLVTNY